MVTSNSKGYALTGALIRAAVVSSLGGLLFGFDTAVIAGTTGSVKTLFGLSDWWMGFVVSSALIGTIVGALISSRPAETIGRRDYLIVLAILFIISAVGCALAWDFWSLSIARFIGGIGIGGSSVISPMYIAEISPAKIGGRLVILFQFNVCLGILVAYFSNALIELMNFDVINTQWRVMFGAGGIPAVLFFFLLFSIPRSPRWLMSKGRDLEARSILEKIGEIDIEKAFSDIQRSLRASKEQADESLFQKKYSYAIFLGVSVAAFNQLSFVNGYLYYLNDTLKEIGATFGGKFQPVIIGLANVIAVTVALSTIDKIGRKKLLLIGSWGSAIPLVMCAYIAWTRTFIELFPWSVALFILFFSFSQGAVIWVYISEVFPNKVRSKGLALGSFTHWGLCAIAATVYPPIVASASYGLAIPFLFGSVMMVIQFFVVLFFFIETKGIALEQIEREMGKDQTTEPGLMH
jgi:sugar porter (SP) family MFS transporter